MRDAIQSKNHHFQKYTWLHYSMKDTLARRKEIKIHFNINGFFHARQILGKRKNRFSIIPFWLSGLPNVFQYTILIFWYSRHNKMEMKMENESKLLNFSNQFCFLHLKIVIFLLEKIYLPIDFLVLFFSFLL